ncbi:ABC transporter permease [Psychrosphaera haliotis]|uniref:ABC transporter n=1 Tax=Psychrosphaera haliotis TaxID=555083 RepID=A0A6N8F5C4_9GAMM|nr:ABC transporter permease [Psychrosphaera haliotis]MUH71388.1 ABC transporter [Psychrosphaera haliotis]
MAKVQKRGLLTVWSNVIFALLLRQLQSKFSDKFGVAWLVAQPVLFIVVLGTLRGRIDGGDVHGLPPFVFMLLGFVTVLQFIQGWSGVSSSMKKDKPLYAFRQVQPFASVLSAALLEFVTFVIIMLTLSYIAILMGDETSIHDPLSLILFMVELQVLSYALGLIFGIGKFFIIELSKVESMLNRPIIFVSGTFFSLNDMPVESWPYLSWNPILHAIELSRHAVNDKFPLADPISATYLHMCVIVTLFFALALYFNFWKKAISR